MSVARQGKLTSGVKVCTQPPDITISDIGLVTLRETFKCNGNDLLRLIPTQGNRHSNYPNLVCKIVSPRFLPGGLGEWTAEFRGGQINGTGGGLPPPVYEVVGTMSTEPIRTSSNWSVIEQGVGVDGIITDDDGLFVGFNATSEAVQSAKLAGIESFLSPGVIFRKRYLSRTKPSGLTDLGSIDSPAGNEPAIGSRNWLKIEFTYTEEADVFAVSEGWMLSGKDGWNELVYRK
ncbi:hypothetical protein [Rubellicoccus peritrichatus]|uniref:Uncharacterized protein n=1 Tax=Rubellicoccus peritrichatus TaxID=3080537 RepID=A0AAQ3L7J1_9BACT|nr:hypothetical protein [Puniceicoccus sp. CR14]WOO40374.1 hypothetical protein RZN69_17280 [Puniceicoccus sp. CR14]WOO40423.1 hypothetical protein RZN69_17525 [Puniceicoccus sp. CR14]WOO40472.1 hypothetical protein RZN69_17770 [Puniceicoccus sp. CR14]WOO40521.1 hypothetical protein RZN69_18015 [Puniceicoccus sp. CR14]